MTMDDREYEEYWESVKASFLKIWIHGFSILLGWPESRTLAWAEKWRYAFESNDEGRILFHENAEDLMIFELLPQTLKKRLRDKDAGLPRQWALVNQFGEAIRGDFRNTEVEYFTDQDWQLAKRRVQKLLAEFGESLPGES